MDRGLALCAMLFCGLISQLTALTEQEIDSKIASYQTRILNALTPYRFEEGRGYFGSSSTFTVVSSDLKRAVVKVSFNQPFTTPPMIFFEVHGLVVDAKNKYILVAYARDITVTGFEAVCETWDNAQMPAVWFHWIARSR
ncbi:uncharacterized protein LOC131943612 [Physella acuta]|uniref:uncharacterized protein LOC131943612 n=1 Tax=Physella acuta TaxID=109671 RepID=UPI0027DE4BD2|nr:uncharacterized protein LOC131943612 [Physella acuta]